MKFEKIEKDEILSYDQLFRVKGGMAATNTVNLTYKDVQNDEEESDRSEDKD